MLATKLLSAGDEPALLAFLHQYPESSLFLLANLQQWGLSDFRKPDAAIYAASVVDGTIQGVASLTSQGTILLQAPLGAALLARQLVTKNRQITGIIGPWQQVVAVGVALESIGFPTSVMGRERLFTLELNHFILPPTLNHAEVKCRLASAIDLDLLTRWRIAFRTEVFGDRLPPQLVDTVRSELDREIAKERLWLLSLDGLPVAMAAINVELPAWVQIGGVYTLPEYRDRGLGRAVVAGSLLAAKHRGIERAVLFTGEHNYPAQTAYQRLGFEYQSDYSLVLFQEPLDVERLSNLDRRIN